MAKPVKRLHFDFQTIGSIAAMVIGASALFVAWDQAQVMRKQQHASVWPLVSAEFNINPSANSLAIEMDIANRGVGPALIESAFLTVNGERSQGRAELMRAIFGDKAPSGGASIIGSSIEASALAAGETAQVFRVSWEKSDENSDAFMALAKKYLDGDGPQVSMNVCYCSVFDRCFISKGEGRPERIKACPAPTGLFSNLLGDKQAAVPERDKPALVIENL